VPTTEVVAAARKFSWEEEADLAQQEALEAQANEEEEEEQQQTSKEVAKETGTQAAGLKEHVKHIWLMYQEQEAGKDEKDRALLMALQGPDEEDKELALQNEMKLLKTGEDAIAFFAKHGDQSDLQVIFCNPAPEEEGKYKPYDLVVVDEQDRGAEFFMISPKGIVHVCPGKQSEHFTLTDWMHQVMVFTVLVSMAFFRNYLTGRAFSRWRKGSAKQIFATHRQRLSQRLFLAKPVFAGAQVKVHGILRNMGFVRLLHFDTQHRSGMELRPFLVQQRELCERADLDSTAEAAREVVDATIKELMSNRDSTNPMAMLAKKRRSGKMSVYLERQEAELEAYLQRLCEFNRSLIGQFLRLVDVMQQSCLVDLAVSKACTLFKCLERTPKLFQASAAFELKSEGARGVGSDKASAPMVLHPGRQEFIQGLEKVLEHISAAVNQVAPVATYRKYSRHLKTNAVAALAGHVVAQDRTFRAAQRDLVQQIHTDFDKAQQLCESHFAQLYDIYLHQQKWDPDAIEKSHQTHTQLAEGMAELQTFDKYLDKMKTTHASGFLHIEAHSLKSSLVPHVESGLQFLKVQLRALASKTCKLAVERFTEVNHKLQERPKVLEQIVEYVKAFKQVEANLPNLEKLKTSVEEMYGTLFQHGVRTDMGEDFNRDLLHQRATNLENTVLPGAQFFVNDQGDIVCSEVSNRFSMVEQECEDLETEITTGMAADPSHLQSATHVLEYLDEVQRRLDDISKTFQYLNDCYTLFMQDPQDTDILEEAQQLLKERCQLWEVALQWADLQEHVASVPILQMDVLQLRCRLEGFMEVLSYMSTDMPGDEVISELFVSVQAWVVERIPVYTQLTNPALSDHHLLQAFGLPGNDVASLKVSNFELIFSFGPAGDATRKNLAVQLQKATAEHCLSTTVACVTEAWERTEMRLKRPESMEAPVILDDQSEILAQIQEDITSLEVVLRSSDITPSIQEPAEETYERLCIANDVLEELVALQERYVLVEPLYRLHVLEADEEIVGAQAVEQFAATDETFRLLMHRGATSCRNVFHFAFQASLSKMLGRITEGLSLAERGVAKLLDSQRRQAPRLWFLNDALLVRALVAAQDLGPGERDEKEPERPVEEEVAGRTFAKFAPWLFPWIVKASAGLDQAALPEPEETEPPERTAASKEVVRQGTAGDIARQELDRVLGARKDSVSMASPQRAAEGAQAPQKDWKGALFALAPGGQARDKRGMGSSARLSQSLSALADDVAETYEQGVAVERPLWTRWVVLYSSEGEAVALQPGSAKVPRRMLFGDWVGKTEKTMKQIIGEKVREVLGEVGAGTPAESVDKWLAPGAGAIPPGQAILVAIGIFFAFSVQATLSEDGPSLVEVGQMLSELRQVLTRHLRRISLKGLQRVLASSLLLQAIHFREVLDALECTAQYCEPGRLLDSFEWQRQFLHRCDFATGEVLICCLDWTFRYGCEYVGCVPRLVRTPHTERCFLTFAAAMRQQNPAACGLAGHPGCAKAELVRELATMAAVPLLENNPMHMDATATMHTFAGLLATNAWCFMRWPTMRQSADSEAVSKLAVLAASLREFQLAMRSDGKDVTLGLCQVRVASPGAALFLAMPRPSRIHSLQERGAVAMPAALTQLLRPISLVRSGALRVLTALLQVEGFEPQESARLAAKLLAVANDVVFANTQTPEHDVQDHSLRRLRSAAQAAGTAFRKGASFTGILLLTLSRFAPGQGSLEQRFREGPFANSVLEAQTQLLRNVCDEEEGAKLVAGDHFQLLLLKDPAADQSVGEEVDSFFERSCLSKGELASSSFSDSPADDEQAPSRLSLVAEEILQHAHAGYATVLLGPACSGKTTLLKALHNATNRRPEPEEDANEGSDREDAPEPPARALYIWQVYPGALDSERLYGTKKGESPGMLPEVLGNIDAGSSKQEAPDVCSASPARASLRSRIDLVTFDGEVDASWADELWPLLCSRHTIMPNSGTTALPGSVEFLFETQSLARASPAFCTHCALSPIEGLLDTKHLLKAFSDRLESGAAGRCARIHGPVLMTWLGRMATGIRTDLDSGSRKTLMWAGEVVAASQLLKLLEATLLAAMPMMDDLSAVQAGSRRDPDEDGSEKEEVASEVATLLEVWTIWAAAWALGGHLPSHERKRLGAWLLATLSGKDGLPYGLAALGTLAQAPENLWKLRILSNVAATSGVPDLICETKVKLVSELMVDKEEPQGSSIFVPTEDTESICQFIRHQAYTDVDLGVRVLGAPQSGKSALAQLLLRSTTTGLGQQPELFRCPHGATNDILSRFLKLRMPRLSGGMRLIVDDVHMASGSLQERFRQVMETGSLATGVLQRAGASLYGSRVCIDVLGNATETTQGKRWLRHFLVLQLPAPQDKVLNHLCDRLVLHWSTSIPSEEARMLLISHGLATKIVSLVREAAGAFQQMPQRLFPVLPLVDVAKWFKRLLQTTDLVTSTAMLKQVVWYEGTQQLGSRLERHEDRRRLADMFEEAGLYRSAEETNGPCTVALNKGTAEFWNEAEAKENLRRSAQMLELGMPFAVYEDMIGAVLGIARALQLGSPSQAAGALLLGCPGSGRKTCAKLGVDLAKTKLKEPTAEDSAGLRDELATLHGTIRSRSGSHTYGPLTEDHLLHGDCETILEDIDNILRQATRFEAKKTSRKAARRGSRGFLGIVRPNSTVEGGKVVEEGLSDNFPDGASLAFLLILSPSLAANWFRRQLRKYPGIASGMDVVWLQPWGQEAYLEVAKQVLLPEVLAGSEAQEAVHQHPEDEFDPLRATAEVAGRLPNALRQSGALRQGRMPGIALFTATVTKLKQLITVKEAELEKENAALDEAASTLAHISNCATSFRSQFSGELDKAKEAEQDMARLAEQQEDLQRQVKEADTQAAKLHQRKTEITAEVKKFEDSVAETMADAHQNLRMAALDLRAVPQAIVDDFAAAELPSERLQLIFFALLDALGMEESWDAVVGLFLNDFAQQLQDLELEDMADRTALMEERYKRLELMGGLKPEEETFLAKAVRSWGVAFIAAVDKYREVTDEVATIRQLKEQVREVAEEEHKTKEAMKAMQRQIQQTVQQSNQRRNAIDKARRSMGRTHEEVGGLKRLDELLSSPQVEMWQNRAGEITVEKFELNGRLLLGCFVAHYGGYLNPEGQVFAQWRRLCVEHQLLEEHGTGYDMPETKLVQLVLPEQESYGMRPLPPSLMLAESGGPPPLLCDPFGAARATLSRRLYAEDNVLPEELQTTSVLGGSFAAAKAEVTREAKTPASLFVLLGEEFSGSASQIPKTLPPGLHPWLLTQKEFAPGKLFVFSTGSAAPAASETACWVRDFGWAGGEVLENCFLDEVVRLADPQLHEEAIKARKTVEFDQHMTAESSEKLLIRVGDKDEVASDDVFALLPFVDQVTEMRDGVLRFERQLEKAQEKLSEVEMRMDAWRQPVRVALVLLHLASAAQEWHPGYHAEIQRCTQWIWRYFAAGQGQSPETLASDMPSAWLAGSAARFFPRHHSCLAVCAALASCREVQRNDAVAGVLFASVRFAARELAGEASKDEGGAAEEMDGGRKPDFISARRWKEFLAAKEQLPLLVEVEERIIEEPERWMEALESGEEALPFSLGLLGDLVTLAILAPQLLPARLEQLAVQELGSRGAELLSGSGCAGDGPAERIRQAVYESAGAGRGPPPVILFLTEEEFGSELRSTVQLSLESCAAEARVSLEVASFLDPSVGSEVHRTLLRTQKAHSGWLLLLDAAEAPLQRLIPKDPELLHSLNGLLSLVQASIQAQGEILGPSVLVALQVHHRPGHLSSLPALRHLFGPDGARVCVSAPRELRANLLATAADLHEPSHSEDHERGVLMANLVCFHTLLQQRGRLGGAFSPGSRWSFADLTFATEVLARCLKPGQPRQEATQTLLAGIYVDCRLANHGFVEALALDFSSFAGPLEPLEVLLPAELWSQLGDSVGIEDLCGFLEVAQESWRPGTGRDESMLQALLCVPDSVLVQHASPDLHFRLRPTACCLLEAVAHGMDCATQPDEKSDPFLLRRLEDVMADLVPCLKDLWPVDGEKGDAVWQTLLRELQRYNVWQRAVAQTLEATDRVLRMAQQDDDITDAVCTALWNEEVPELWCRAAGGMLDCSGLPLASWLREAFGRHNYLDAWCTECVPRVSYWLSGLFCPSDLLTAFRRNAAEQRALPLDSVTLVVSKYGGPSVTSPREPWNLQAIFEQANFMEDMERLVDGVEGAFPVGACPLLHGLYLTGSHWSQQLVAAPGPESNEWLPPLRLLPLTAEEFGRHRRLEDKSGATTGRQKYFSCPIYRHRRRGERPLLELEVPSSEDAARWERAGVAMLCELPRGF